ncbi:MAG: prepilin peptidase [Planctomycetaceae bacterium]|nr:prepilin peptidase [Planctomycetaceae bacterium]
MLPVAWIPLTLTFVAVIHDLRTREVPDWISVVVLVGGVIATALGSGAETWSSFVLATLVAAIIGFTLFALGGWGGADVKLLVALAGWLGLGGLLAVMFWMAIVGAALAILYRLRGASTLPYIPAIAAGLLIHIVWPDALTHLVRGSD